jgi:predicted ATPase
MLERIRIQGYRALRDVTIEVTPGVPLVVIGANATGKSSLLDALAVLCKVAQGQVGRALHDRGGWGAVSWRGDAPTIEWTVRFAADSFAADGGPVEYSVQLGRARGGTPTILDEEVRVYKRGLDHPPLVVLKGGAKAWVRNVQTRELDSAAPVSGGGSILTNSILAGVTDPARYPTCLRLKDLLQTIAIYPSFALRASVDDGEGAPELLGGRPVEWVRRIRSSGRDLLTALYTLSQEHAAAWTALESDLRAVFPWCESLRFPPGPGRGLITLTWVDARSGATLYIDDMSEGMRVYLALLAALHAQDQPALLAFDEPERSLHPRALRRIVKVMESRAEATPLIVATHSDRLLDFLDAPAESLRITRFSSEDGVVMERLDPEVLRAWLEDYSLGELRSRDRLDPPDDGEGP